MGVRRSLDACSPFVVWASPDGAGLAQCDHGIWVDTRLDAGDLARGATTLTIRAVERSDATSVSTTSDPVDVTCLLDTGGCTANDDGAASFLAEHLWFETHLQAQLHVVRQRVARAAAQRDRETSARRALANIAPGTMIVYADLFPADWDLLVTHDDDGFYWGVDQYCSNPACDCTQVAVTIHRLREGESAAPVIGRVRLDLALQRPTIDANTSLAGAVFATLWATHEATLRARRDEARRAVLRYAGAKVQHISTSTAPTGSRAPRNAPCPCGSGKKFKRCCLGVRADDARLARPRS